jgi:hypothetical protein
MAWSALTTSASNPVALGASFVSGRAAVLLGRNYVGVDIDRKAVVKGRAWLEEA